MGMCGGLIRDPSSVQLHNHHGTPGVGQRGVPADWHPWAHRRLLGTLTEAACGGLIGERKERGNKV